MYHEHLKFDTNARGAHWTMPQTNHVGASAQAYESSNANGPSVWFALADEQGNVVYVELNATSAYHFAEAIMNLLRCHYQGDARPDDRVTAFLTNEIPGRE